tara:strand:+ start:1358 stop:3061 length:1704 start_codon:yes stop_codon:yes gene_type:complete
MRNEKVNLLALFKEKKYYKIIIIIEQIKNEDKTPALLNLLGVCRMMSGNSNETIRLAIDDFRNSYFKEVDKKKSKETIKNLINASVSLFDSEYIKNQNELSNNFFDEINLIYQENQELFHNDLNLMKAILKVFKRTSSVKRVIDIINKATLLHSDPDLIASYNFFNNYINDWSQKDHFDNSKKINDRLPVYSSQELINFKLPKNNKINVGFISSDIKSKHSITYFLKSLLTSYNKDKFKIHLYHNHDLVDDETVVEFNKYAYKYLHISRLKDVEAINKIREDEIDIMIDLNGFSSNHRLPLIKNRLAPIQVSWCGYTNTTGLNEMDYLIVDKNLIKPEEENFYSEKIIYLSNIWNCHCGYPFERLENDMPSEKNKFITFGCFNNFRKINEDVIEAWSLILKRTKNSKLFLKTSIATSKKLFEKKFEKYGVLESIIFSDYSKNFQDHLNEYKKVDIALDTFPWNGVTTSFEAVWMNVPVIVMDGYNFNSRCGFSINKNLKLINLIAKNKEEYINKAVTIAEDKEMLKKIRKNLFENALNSALFDKKKFSDEFFNSLEKIYSNRVSNLV